MKPLLILLFIITAAQHVFAQDTLTTTAKTEPFNAVRLGATTISVFIPVVQLGVERRWQRHSLVATAGVVVPKAYNLDNTLKGTGHGCSFRIDGRLHSKAADHSGAYIGVGVFYNWFRYPHVEYFGDSLDWEYFGEGERDEFLLSKSTLGCVLQFGGQRYISKRFYIDLSLGIGPKVMFTTHEGRTSPSDYAFYRHYNVSITETRTGTQWAVAAQGQLSVAYILGK